MSFQDAVRTCLTQKYAGFSGRARRSEYWYFVLFTIIVGIVASIIDTILGTKASNGAGLIYAIAELALLLPGIAVAVRRLHDTSRSGWWLLLGLIPIIGSIVLIVFFVQDSHGENQYGPSPKALDAPAYQDTPPPAPRF